MNKNMGLVGKKTLVQTPDMLLTPRDPGHIHSLSLSLGPLADQPPSVMLIT